MAKLVIIADDFTGALDTAVQFSKNSINTIVVLYKDLKFEKLDAEAQVIVVDTESRHVSKQEAAQRVKMISRQAMCHGVTHFYKKTDSVLRGNVGSELDALMEGTDSEEIMFIPAYPDAKRTTVDGVQLVDQIPIAQTSFARDPLDPVRHSYIPSMLRSQVDVHVELVKKKGLRSDGKKKTVYVFDAEDNNDLLRIGMRLRKENRLRVTAGCAGFANMLLEVLDLPQTGRNEDVQAYRNMLVICGSVNELSIQQTRYAEDHGFYSVTLDPQQKLESGYFLTQEGSRLVEEIVRLLDTGRNVIVKSINEARDEERCRAHAETLHIDTGKIPFLITQNIAQLVREIAVRKNLSTLVVFGGDTTVEIAEVLGLDGVLPKAEIMTGVVLSETFGMETGINLVTKSGGFGEEDVLVKIQEYMSAMSASIGNLCGMGKENR